MSLGEYIFLSVLIFKTVHFYVLMVFTIFGCLLVEKIKKIKFLLAHGNHSLILKNLLVTLFNSGFMVASVTLKVVPKAACDSNCF